MANRSASRADVHCSADHSLTGCLLHGQRLACEGRLVEDGHPLHHTIHRHHVPLADEQTIVRLNGVERDLLEPAVSMAEGRSRHAREQSRHLAAGATLGEALQVLSARIHQGHDHCSQVLPEDQGAGHGESRDDVETHFSPPETRDDFAKQGAQHRNRRGSPDDPRPRLAPGQSRDES